MRIYIGFNTLSIIIVVEYLTSNISISCLRIVILMRHILVFKGKVEAS